MKCACALRPPPSCTLVRNINKLSTGKRTNGGWPGEVAQLVEYHLVEVVAGGSSPLFPILRLKLAILCRAQFHTLSSQPPWWNGKHSRLKICVLLVQVRQGALIELFGKPRWRNGRRNRLRIGVLAVQVCLGARPQRKLLARLVKW